MCANTSGERRWRARSFRLRSFQAGSTLWNTPGVSPTPYQPSPNPSPFVVSAPSRECRLWSTSECLGLSRNSSIKTGDPEYASQRHMVAPFVSCCRGRQTAGGPCSSLASRPPGGPAAALRAASSTARPLSSDPANRQAFAQSDREKRRQGHNRRTRYLGWESLEHRHERVERAGVTASASRGGRDRRRSQSFFSFGPAYVARA